MLAEPGPTIAAAPSGISGSSSSSAFGFAAALARFAGWRLVPALAVALALALTEGAGLILLIPLLGTIGLVVGEGSTRGMAAWTERLFAFAGLTPSLVSVLAVFLLVSLVYATLYRWHLLLTPALEQQFVLALKERLYRAIVSARWSFLVKRRMTDMGHALLSDMERVSGSAHQLLTLVAGSAVTFIYIGVAARLSPGLTLVVCAGGVATLLLLRGRNRQSADRSEAVSEAHRRVYAMVTESLAGVKVAKIVAAEPRDIEVYRGLTRASSSRYLELLRSFADAKRRLDLASAAGVVVLLLVAVLRFDIRGPGLLLIVFVFARVMPRMLSLQGSAQLFLAGLPAFANIMRLIAACEAAAEWRRGGRAVARRRHAVAHVRCRDVRVRLWRAGARSVHADHQGRPHDRAGRRIRRGEVHRRGSRDGAAVAIRWPVLIDGALLAATRAAGMAPQHRVCASGWLSVSRHDSAQHAVGLSVCARGRHLEQPGNSGRQHVRRQTPRRDSIRSSAIVGSGCRAASASASRLHGRCSSSPRC